MLWPTERVIELQQLYESGLSVTQISRQLGVSPGAVFGKLYRMHRPLRRSQESSAADVDHTVQLRNAQMREQIRKEHEIANRTNDVTVRSILVARARALGELKPLLPVSGLPTPADQPRTPLLDLQRGECRWPIGEVGEPAFGFCAKPVRPASSYCAQHARLAVREEWYAMKPGTARPKPTL